MTKKRQEPETPPMGATAYVKPDYLPESTPENTAYTLPSPALQALIDSGIVTMVDGAVVWREGHLEYLAQQYLADRNLTLLNYADDILIAQQYSWQRWNELTAQ